MQSIGERQIYYECFVKHFGEGRPNHEYQIWISRKHREFQKAHDLMNSYYDWETKYEFIKYISQDAIQKTITF